jgi:uncharacterized membrane protein
MEMQTQPMASHRVNVGKTERGISVAAAVGLLSYVVLRRPRMSIPLALDAGYMVYRGATGHCVFYQMMDINRAKENGHEGIQVVRAITINRPKDQLYRIWRNFENLPRFMKHLISVRTDPDSEGLRSHWVAMAPLAREIEWDSEVTEELENEYLAWKSLPGSPVESAGSVHFSDAPGGRGTVLTVSMQYNPPAGSMGAAFAKLFGEEPSQQVRDDLRHFKQMMETGEIASVEGQSSGRSENFGRSIAERQREKDIVEEASIESFPASDPPAWTVGKRV